MDDNDNDSDQTEVSERYLSLTGLGFSKQINLLLNMKFKVYCVSNSYTKGCLLVHGDTVKPV